MRNNEAIYNNNNHNNNNENNNTFSQKGRPLSLDSAILSFGFYQIVAVVVIVVAFVGDVLLAILFFHSLLILYHHFAAASMEIQPLCRSANGLTIVSQCVTERVSVGTSNFVHLYRALPPFLFL